LLSLLTFQKVSLSEIIGAKLSFSLSIVYCYRLSTFSFIDYRYRSTQIWVIVPSLIRNLCCCKQTVYRVSESAFFLFFRQWECCSW